MKKNKILRHTASQNRIYDIRAPSTNTLKSGESHLSAKGTVTKMKTGINDKKLIFDGMLLTVTALALKTAGVMFSSGLTTAAGTEAMGLSAQISSVYAFAITAASAGVNLGTMRLTSESRGANKENEIRAGIRCALTYCARTGFLTAILLFLSAPLLSLKLIGNRDALLPICLLAIAVPFISASGAFHGYFNGVRRVYKSAAVSVTEQAIRITITLSGIYGISGKSGILPSAFTKAIGNTVILLSRIDLPFYPQITASKAGIACLAVVFGSVTAELSSFLILLVLYLKDRKRYPAALPLSQSSTHKNLTAKFLSITAPMAISAILRSGLSAAEHLLLPRGLRIYGSESALSDYGVVCGMAIPVVLYPMALISSFAQLSTADISARASGGETADQLGKRVSRSITFAIVYGIGCSAILRAFAYRLGDGLFSGSDAGIYIAALAGYAALSYLDHTADAALKGLNCQSYVMKVNILDSAIGLLFAVVIVPKAGIVGYVFSLYFCELLNCAFSLWKLTSVLHRFPNPIKIFFPPLVCSLAAISLAGRLRIASLPLPSAVSITAAVYITSVLLLNLAVKRKLVPVRFFHSKKRDIIKSL